MDVLELMAQFCCLCWAVIFIFFTCSSAIVEKQQTLTDAQVTELREEVREMFTHAYDGYMRCAFPKDELKPITCGGEDVGIAGG